MPKEAHIEAAKHHEAAAKSHRLAAEHFAKEEQEAVNEKSAEAFHHAQQAWASSKHASEKSIRHTMHG